ncbi:hypothetical protein MYAM1_002906 [Malassezia yamatoensis]|uniref:Elongation factor 1 alpha-like protein n=1 Tax=Malassezia yamatoensis TaxID=253288 RepID=A0AAJ5YT01_9BASI|nr:hypothetical protein MYAM1_002906 [Malassezia yamatoensis]
MSRHRAVRNLDLGAELAQDEGDDLDYLDDMSPEDQEAMDDALIQMQEELGPQQNSFSEREMREALYETYFNVDGAIALLVQEREKEEALAKKRAGMSLGEEEVAALRNDTSLAIRRRRGKVPRTDAAHQFGSKSEKTAPLSTNSAKKASAEMPSSVSQGSASKAKENLMSTKAELDSQSAEKTPCTTPLPSDTPASSPQPGKKLSKLQQKLQAAKAKQASLPTTPDRSRPSSAMVIDRPSPRPDSIAGKPGQPMNGLHAATSTLSQTPRGLFNADSSVNASVGPATTSATDRPNDHRPLAPQSGLAPSGESISSLFPSLDSRSEAKNASSFVQVLETPISLRSYPFQPEPMSDNEVEQLRKAFAGLSPDEVVLQARQKERAKAANAAQRKPAPGPVQQLRGSIQKMDLESNPHEKSAKRSSSQTSQTSRANSPAPKLTMSRQQARTEAKDRDQRGQREIGLVVVGHVDSGKSTLMGRMLHEYGQMRDRDHEKNVRGSAKIGKGSFAYAWALDSSEEERERGVTIDVAQDTFRTSTTLFHLLDAPGHSDFVPNMISGAAQADAAILVIDAILGAFEAGFLPRGQTREHATLLRSLGVHQLVVAVNKLDAASYDQARYEEILHTLRPFLAQCGFDLDRHVQFVPVAAAVGWNVAHRDSELAPWYTGKTLAEVLDALVMPPRMIDAPLRMPVTNVFRSTSAISSGLGVAGRIVSGLVQVGELLRPLPGDESGVVRAIECENQLVQWAAAGSNATLYFAHLEQNQVNVGSVLCPPDAPIALVSEALVQLLVFQPTYPLVQGTALEVFFHSADLPGELTELVSLLDKSSGDVVKKKPRVLTQNSAATARIRLGDGKGYPIETFSKNKEMARLLFRMHGETVAAGIVLETS